MTLVDFKKLPVQTLTFCNIPGHKRILGTFRNYLARVELPQTCKFTFIPHFLLTSTADYNGFTHKQCS